eukprot:PhM_4_TR3454/c0_g1_i1/m.51129
MSRHRHSDEDDDDDDYNNNNSSNANTLGGRQTTVGAAVPRCTSHDSSMSASNTHDSTRTTATSSSHHNHQHPRHQHQRDDCYESSEVNGDDEDEDDDDSKTTTSTVHMGHRSSQSSSKSKHNKTKKQYNNNDDDNDNTNNDDSGEEDADDDEEYDDDFAPVTAQWATLQSTGLVPGPREGHVAVTHLHHSPILFVHGGSQFHPNIGSILLECLYEYDLEKMEWNKVSCQNAPSAREGHTAVMFDQTLYVFGGRTEKQENFVVHACDMLSHEWRVLATTGTDVGSNTPSSRQTSVACAAGGSADSVGSGASFDPNRLSLHASPRYQHTTCLWRHYVYLFGGANDDCVFGDVHRLDLGTNRWERVPTTNPGPCARYLHSAVVIGDEMIIHGGAKEDMTDLDDTWHLHLDENVFKHRWSVGPPANPRCAYGCCEDPDHKLMFVFGGCSGDEYRDDLVVYDAHLRRWHQIRCQRGPAPEQRSNCALIHSDNRIYVFGGTTGDECLADLSVMTLDDRSMHALLKPRALAAAASPVQPVADDMCPSESSVTGCDDNSCGGAMRGDRQVSDEVTMSMPSYGGHNPTTLDDFLAVSGRNSSVYTGGGAATTCNTDITVGNTPTAMAPPCSSPIQGPNTPLTTVVDAQTSSSSAVRREGTQPAPVANLNHTTNSAASSGAGYPPVPPPSNTTTTTTTTTTSSSRCSENNCSASTTTTVMLSELMRCVLQLQDRFDRHSREVNIRVDELARRLDRTTEDTQQRIRELRDAVYGGVLLQHNRKQ